MSLPFLKLASTPISSSWPWIDMEPSDFFCSASPKERRKVGVREVLLAVSCSDAEQNREEKLPGLPSVTFADPVGQKHLWCCTHFLIQELIGGHEPWIQVKGGEPPQLSAEPAGKWEAGGAVGEKVHCKFCGKPVGEWFCWPKHPHF